MPVFDGQQLAGLRADPGLARSIIRGQRRYLLSQ